MITLVLLSLWLAFRRPTEILLSVGVLLLSGACLLTVMRLAGWSWNLLNLMALPLMLGSGVDYSIFMQLALRRHHGNLSAAHRSVGRALLLCGGTAVAGFGSLSWSTNAGMASLGEVCAVGIGCNMLISVFLLPVWWRACLARGKLPGASPRKPGIQPRHLHPRFIARDFGGSDSVLPDASRHRPVRAHPVAPLASTCTLVRRTASPRNCHPESAAPFKR